MPQEKLRIAVIGCGISGLVAARELADRGHEVSCFDKSRGVGGRMSVRRAEGFEFDHGAQYFTARDERLVARVPRWITAGVIAEWKGRFVTLEYGKTIERDPQLRYVGTPGMNALAKNLSEGLNITTQSLITRIEREKNHWYLQTAEREIGRFDRLILSVPAPQARVLLADYPTLLSSLAPVVMEPCWAVMAGFDEPIPVEFDGAFCKGSALSWIAKNSSKPGRTANEAWVLHATSEWSAEHLEDQAEQVADEMFGEFQRLVGKQSSPEFLQAHRWRFARAASPLHVGAVIDQDLSIAICGDWCAGDRVEGAYLSGLAAVASFA